MLLCFIVPLPFISSRNPLHAGRSVTAAHARADCYLPNLITSPPVPFPEESLPLYIRPVFHPAYSTGYRLPQPADRPYGLLAGNRNLLLTGP